MTADTLARLRDRLPTFAEASNPLDITAQGLKDMPLYADASAMMAADPGSSGVLVAVMPGSPEVGNAQSQGHPAGAGSEREAQGLCRAG